MTEEYIGALEDETLAPKKGCFTWFRCLGCAIVLLLCFIGGCLVVSVGGPMLVMYMLVEPTSISIPDFEFADDELNALDGKVNAFVAQLKDEDGEDPELVLNGKELTLLLSEKIHEEGNLLVTLEEDRIDLKASFSDGEAHVNLNFKGTISVRDGQLGIDVDAARVGRLNLPEGISDALIQQMIDTAGPEYRDEIEKVKLFEIRDGRAHIILDRNLIDVNRLRERNKPRLDMPEEAEPQDQRIAI
ncbi:hypothetical protein ACFL1X_07750 [Candidatus Hydrogenedentota bacterium]